MNQITTLYRKIYYRIHFSVPVMCISAILLVVNMMIGQGILIAFAVTMCVNIYPFIDVATFEQKHFYRLFSGVVMTLFASITILMGSVSAHYGVGWVLIGYLFPVLFWLFFYTMTGNIQMIGIIFPLAYTIGISSPGTFQKMLGVVSFVGVLGIIMVGIYFFYYLLMIKIGRKKGHFHLKPSEVVHHVKTTNPRVYRFAVNLYIVIILAYLSSLLLGYLFPQFVNSGKSYWAGFFVFVMLQFNNNLEKTLVRVWSRVSGTIVGVFISWVLLNIFHQKSLRLILFLCAIFCFLQVIYHFEHYFYFAVTASVFVMFMYVILLKADTTIYDYRISETFIAGCWVVFSIYIFWPMFRKIIPMGKWELKE